VLLVKAAVLGSPVSHSLSPVLHNAAYLELGLAHSYSAIEVSESELGGFLEGINQDWLGVSLTMPLKEVAFDFADTCDELATVTGAINTLVFRSQVKAFNTDVLGLIDAISEAGTDQVSSAVIFGSGATARSALVAAHRLGAQEVTCVARNATDVKRMASVAEVLGVTFSHDSLNNSGWLSADVVVNTTPVGALDAIAQDVYSPKGLLLDVVYNPWPTQLAASWALTGGTIVSGLAMLLHQAGHQVTLMTGKPAPVEQMRAALNAELLARGLSTI
jgi:shikimate dehydrogenase